MARVHRTSLSFAAIFSLLFVVLLGLGWWALHTAWFSNLLRARTIAALEQITGGRVELGSFNLNPDHTRVKITGLVIHGTEPSDTAPLLSIDSVELNFQILSLWRRSVDLQLLEINHPEINLLQNADGSTNIPTPKHRNNKPFLQQLMDLKVGQLDIKNGFLQVFNRRLPFHFESQDIGLILNYNNAGGNYEVAFQTRIANMALQAISFNPLSLTLKARLFRDHADVPVFKIVTDQAASTIELQHAFMSFARGTVDAGVVASLSIDELTRLPKIDEFLRSGRGTAVGNVHINANTGQFLFTGKGTAEGVDFLTAPFSLRNTSGEADIIADNDGMLLRHAVAHARGANFKGQGSIKHYSFLEVDADFAQVGLKEVGTYLTKEQFPWSGSAHGTAHVYAMLTDKQPDFNIKAKADVDPGSGGIPTSGNVDVTYHLRTQDVEFGDSVLHLPHSNISFSGALGSDLTLSVESSSLADFQPLIPILHANVSNADLPVLMPAGRARVDGSLNNLFHQPVIKANVALNAVKFRGNDWDSVTGQVSYSPTAISVAQLNLRQAGAEVSGDASAQLTNWQINSDSALDLRARFANLDVAKTLSMFSSTTQQLVRGVASGNINLRGTLLEPNGQGSFQIANLDAYGQQLNKAQFNAVLEGSRVEISKGRVQSGPATLTFSGGYQHSADGWSTGNLELLADTNGFPLASLSTVRKLIPAVNGRAELHVQVAGTLKTASFVPAKLNGSAILSDVSLNGRPIGNVSLRASTTQGASIDFKYNGQLREAKFQGTAQARLTSGTPIRGDVQLGQIEIKSLESLISDSKPPVAVEGYVQGSVAFDGPLEDPYQIAASATINQVEISSAPNIELKNSQPILLNLRNGQVNFTRFELDGRDTSIKLSGSAPLSSDKPLNLKANGKVDLALFALFDPNVKTSGNSELAANITGTFASPNVNGSLQVSNASMFFADLPNGLSDVNGSVIFGRNRAIVQKMTGHSGGGDVSLGGSISFGGGTPVVYQLEAAGRNVRVRYANTISVTGNSDLRLSGTSSSSILSGVITVSRVVFTPNADAGNLLAAAVTPNSAVPDQGDFIAGLHLDLTLESAPNLQVSTNLSRDVEAEIQLNLRGTPEHPVVLGTINANQGDLKIFGTRFSLNRGEVSFVNPIRIEPVLDLDLQTEARGVTIDITVSGTPSKLNFNYRSDPPLQPRDIIALLTVGRAPNVGATGNAQVGNDVSALSSGVNSVLGQAISPVSNRLSKLFGITNIKIDPFTQGITNTPQARLSVEQQVSRNVTVTYVTNLSQTSEQIFRFEWALTRQFSIVALRDDNGEFGIDFQVKKRFK